MTEKTRHFRLKIVRTADKIQNHSEPQTGSISTRVDGKYEKAELGDTKMLVLL
jgi:hypothetical protein